MERVVREIGHLRDRNVVREISAAEGPPQALPGEPAFEVRIRLYVREIIVGDEVE